MTPFDVLATVSTTDGSGSAGGVAGTIGGLIGYAVYVAAVWPVFVKAGRPGWAALIPIYNTYVFVKIAGYHGAMTLLYLVPVANIVIGILVAIRVGRAFGKDEIWSVLLLWLLAIIGLFIVGYGSSRYRADAAAS